MFERNAKNPIDTLIGASTRIEGDLLFCGGLRIDGRRDLLGRIGNLETRIARSEREIDAAQAVRYRVFVEEMKATGFIAAALARHGIQGASVAPPRGNSR